MIRIPKPKRGKYKHIFIVFKFKDLKRLGKRRKQAMYVEHPQHLTHDFYRELCDYRVHIVTEEGVDNNKREWMQKRFAEVGKIVHGMRFKKEMVPIPKCIESMKEIVAKSNYLWLSVNQGILRVLQSKRSRDWMIKRLRAIAGPEKKGEPVSVGNFRCAADQLERGEKVWVL